MKKNLFMGWLVVVLVSLIFTSAQGKEVDSPKEIILGIPTDVGTLSGRDSFRAAVLAVEEINKKGGVKVGNDMLPFRVELADTRDGSPGVPISEALLAVEKLILEKRVNFIVVGSYRSEAILAQMDIVSKYKIPMLASIVVGPQYTKKIAENPKYKYCFRVGIDARGVVTGILNGLFVLKKKFGFDSAYFIVQDVAWCRASADIIEKVIKQKGMKVLGYDRVPTGTSQFASSLTRVKATGAKIIMPIMEMPEGAILVKQVSSMRIPAVVSGCVGELAGPTAWKTYGDKISGVINVYLEMANLPAKKWPRAVAFHEAFKKRWGDDVQISHGPAPAYASVYMLKSAIERAGSLNPDAVVQELEQTDYVGLLGRTRFDKKSHQVIYGTDVNKTAIMANAQWSEGERVIIFPECVAEGVIALPPSLK